MYWQPRSVHEEAQTGLHGGSTDEGAGQGRKIQASKYMLFFFFFIKIVRFDVRNIFRVYF